MTPDQERYERARNYLCGVDPCPLCGKVHPRVDFASLPKQKYAGIDDAGDDLLEWNWMYLNGRCVIARRLTDAEVERLERGEDDGELLP